MGASESRSEGGTTSQLPLPNVEKSTTQEQPAGPCHTFTLRCRPNPCSSAYSRLYGLLAIGRLDGSIQLVKQRPDNQNPNNQEAETNSDSLIIPPIPPPTTSQLSSLVSLPKGEANEVQINRECGLPILHVHFIERFKGRLVAIDRECIHVYDLQRQRRVYSYSILSVLNQFITYSHLLGSSTQPNSINTTGGNSDATTSNAASCAYSSAINDRAINVRESLISSIIKQSPIVPSTSLLRSLYTSYTDDRFLALGTAGGDVYIFDIAKRRLTGLHIRPPTSITQVASTRSTHTQVDRKQESLKDVSNNGLYVANISEVPSNPTHLLIHYAAKPTITLSASFTRLSSSSTSPFSSKYLLSSSPHPSSPLDLSDSPHLRSALNMLLISDTVFFPELHNSFLMFSSSPSNPLPSSSTSSTTSPPSPQQPSPLPLSSVLDSLLPSGSCLSHEFIAPNVPFINHSTHDPSCTTLSTFSSIPLPPSASISTSSISSTSSPSSWLFLYSLTDSAFIANFNLPTSSKPSTSQQNKPAPVITALSPTNNDANTINTTDIKEPYYGEATNNNIATTTPPPRLDINNAIPPGVLKNETDTTNRNDDDHDGAILDVLLEERRKLLSLAQAGVGSVHTQDLVNEEKQDPSISKGTNSGSTSSSNGGGASTSPNTNLSNPAPIRPTLPHLISIVVLSPCATCCNNNLSDSTTLLGTFSDGSLYTWSLNNHLLSTQTVINVAPTIIPSLTHLSMHSSKSGSLDLSGNVGDGEENTKNCLSISNLHVISCMCDGVQVPSTQPQSTDPKHAYILAGTYTCKTTSRGPLNLSTTRDPTPWSTTPINYTKPAKHELKDGATKVTHQKPIPQDLVTTITTSNTTTSSTSPTTPLSPEDSNTDDQIKTADPSDSIVKSGMIAFVLVLPHPIQPNHIASTSASTVSSSNVSTLTETNATFSPTTSAQTNLAPSTFIESLVYYDAPPPSPFAPVDASVEVAHHQHCSPPLLNVSNHHNATTSLTMINGAFGSDRPYHEVSLVYKGSMAVPSHTTSLLSSTQQSTSRTQTSPSSLPSNDLATQLLFTQTPPHKCLFHNDTTNEIAPGGPPLPIPSSHDQYVHFGSTITTSSPTATHSINTTIPSSLLADFYGNSLIFGTLSKVTTQDITPDCLYTVSNGRLIPGPILINPQTSDDISSSLSLPQTKADVDVSTSSATSSSSATLEMYLAMASSSSSSPSASPSPSTSSLPSTSTSTSSSSTSLSPPTSTSSDPMSPVPLLLLPLIPPSLILRRAELSRLPSIERADCHKDMSIYMTQSSTVEGMDGARSRGWLISTVSDDDIHLLTPGLSEDASDDEGEEDMGEGINRKQVDNEHKSEIPSERNPSRTTEKTDTGSDGSQTKGDDSASHSHGLFKSLWGKISSRSTLPSTKVTSTESKTHVVDPLASSSAPSTAIPSSTSTSRSQDFSVDQLLATIDRRQRREDLKTAMKKIVLLLQRLDCARHADSQTKAPHSKANIAQGSNVGLDVHRNQQKQQQQQRQPELSQSPTPLPPKPSSVPSKSVPLSSFISTSSPATSTSSASSHPSQRTDSLYIASSSSSTPRDPFEGMIVLNEGDDSSNTTNSGTSDGSRAQSRDKSSDTFEAGLSTEERLRRYKAKRAERAAEEARKAEEAKSQEGSSTGIGGMSKVLGSSRLQAMQNIAKASEVADQSARLNDSAGDFGKKVSKLLEKQRNSFW